MEHVYTMQHIKKRHTLLSYAMQGWRMNLHLIRGDHYDFVIDTGTGIGSVQPLLEEMGKAPKPVIVVNTHHHWDHVWGNAAFPQGLIVAHTLCAAHIEEGWESTLAQHAHSYGDGAIEKRLPDMQMDASLYFPQEGIRLLYTPGHTDDGISVLDEREGVLNVGDNIGDDESNIVPDLDCDEGTYLSTLRLYQSLAFDTCLSGHNVPLGRGIIDEIAAQVGKGLRDGA